MPYQLTMANQSISSNGDSGVCWQCGAPARGDYAYPLKLVAYSSQHLDGLGYPVTPGRAQDTVLVRVPRCVACRGRGQDSIVILFAGMILGAIIAPILHLLLFANLEPPSWLHVLTHRHAPVGAVSAIGLVVGAVVAISAVALRRRRLGLRSLNSYPPVLALRQAGWHFPSG
jgi:hypothetical protein